MKKQLLLALLTGACITETLAQDTYWAMLDNKRFNTATNTVIGNRPGDLAFALPGGAHKHPRGMFDRTGRNLFTFNQSHAEVDDIHVISSDGAFTAFPIYKDQCKQYMFANVRPTSYHTYRITLQPIDASDMTGTAPLMALPVAGAEDEVFDDGSNSVYGAGIVVAPAPASGHYLFQFRNVVTGLYPWISEQADITRYLINADGSRTTIAFPFGLNGLPAIGGISRISQDGATLGYVTFDSKIITLSSGGVPSALYPDSIGGQIFGLEQVNVTVGSTIERRWYYATASEIGYILEGSIGKTIIRSTGAKSDLAIGINGNIYFAEGNPAIEPGDLSYFDPATGSFSTVSGGNDIVFTNGASYSFGNMVTGENTSIADGYDEYDNYSVAPGVNTWTPASNPGTVYNGGGTYPVLRLNKTLYIPTGSVLILKDMTLEMGPNASILVGSEQEGKGWAGYLKMDKSAITRYTGCGFSQPWDGIQLFGKGSGYNQLAQDPGTTPYSFYHAGLEMINQSKLSFARYAVQTVDATDLSYNGGGFVLATDAFFLNNRKSVAFYPYKFEIIPGVVMPDKSRFVNCEFNVDHKLDIGFLGFISGWGLKGVGITGSDFINGAYDKNEDHYGILGHDFGVSVNQTLAGDKSAFYNLNRAIDLENVAATTTTVTVANSKFVNNLTGIGLRDIQRPLMAYNSFEIGSPADPYGTGINMRGASDYRINNNDFVGTLGQQGNYHNSGIVFGTNSDKDHFVHSNTFTDLTYGCSVLGSNRDPRYGTGLHFECNTYNNNDYAIFINGGDGIAQEQGMVSKASGNTFNTGSYYMVDITNGGLDIFYYYFPGLNQFPATISGPGPINLLAVSTENNCIYPKGEPGEPEDPEKKGGTLSVNAAANAAQATLYPNPASDLVHIRYNGKGNVRVYDLTGKMLLTQQLTGAGTETRIDVRHLTPGVYMYQIEGEHQIVERGKLVKQ